MLSDQGRRLLELLVSVLPQIRVANPKTYISYGTAHTQLGLELMAETYGRSLQRQGLDELARWTKINGFPAITGLIVNMERKSDFYMQPGSGYFDLYERAIDDFRWWEHEIVKSLSFNWAPYLIGLTLVESPRAVDLDIPERVEATVYRILRDSKLSQQIKAIHNNECQICGHTIIMPNGTRYSEAHHIQPLGMPHNGPDVIDNMVCVCPNHHVELDYGVIRLSIDMLRGACGHYISEKYIDYHNNFYGL
ncbi:HNH endonuclease [Alishewanella jeotgali]|uniref:HNH nuclease domain-containing protein n=1 Tax=Alishewanella jeotgali KCTC 22429 TaxID=1129374 RepID=H3ZGI4_9ALTE|nr:HNH endonuclease [Alishewanella jeotgali]EHR40296.1 hypothetical protein AJE_12283 [Alishewanella jeotgali KCTC 22429]